MKYVIPTLLVILAALSFSYWYFKETPPEFNTPLSDPIVLPTLQPCAPNQISVSVDGRRICNCETYEVWAEGVWVCKEAKG